MNTSTPRATTYLQLRNWLTPLFALLILASICFAKLIAQPSGLMVDGIRPSIDHANQGVQRPIGNDLTFLFLPHHLYIARTISQLGHWPLWDPTGFGGRPMVGNPQAGLFYPPVWLIWSWWSPAGLGWLTIAHLLWGGIGAYLLARVTGIGRFGAFVTASCFQASPYLLGHLFEGHYPHVWSVCWFPWAFWAFDSRRQRHMAATLLLPLIIGLVFLIGHPQEGFLLTVALTFRNFIDWTRSQKHEGILARWCGVLFISLGIAAIDLVPQLAVREWKLSLAEAESEIPTHYTLHLVNLLQLVSPEALGSPADYDGYDNSWETLFSFGLVTLLLAIIAMRFHPNRPAVRSWLTLAILTVWIAWGYNLGLYAVMYHLVPGMKMFRVPSRPLFLTSLSIAVLAGMGAEALSLVESSNDLWRRFSRRLLIASVVPILFATAGTYFWKGEQQADPARDVPPTAIGAADDRVTVLKPIIERGWGRERRAVVRVVSDVRVWALAAAVGGLLAVGSLSRQPKGPRQILFALGILAPAELAYWGFTLLHVSPIDRFLGPDPVESSLARMTGTEADQPPMRLKTRDAFYTDLRAIAAGFEKTNIGDSFQISHAALLYEQLYPIASRRRDFAPELPMGTAPLRERQALRQSILDRMSVQYLVSDRIESDPSWKVVDEGAWGESSRYVIQHNPAALPRAYVVGRTEDVEPKPVNAFAQLTKTDPRTTVLTEYDPLEAALGSTADRQAFKVARWTSIDPDRPRIEVETERPSYLVITDTWMPGWSARVNGNPVEVQRANIAQRMIPLANPGLNQVELDFYPPQWRLGITVFILSLVVWSWVCWTTFRKRYVAIVIKPSHDASEPTIPA